MRETGDEPKWDRAGGRGQRGTEGATERTREGDRGTGRTTAREIGRWTEEEPERVRDRG